MVNRATKLRWRRRIRRSQHQVEQMGVQAEKNLDQHLFRRLNRFVSVRRFVFGWIALFALVISGLVVQSRGLSRFYQVLQPGKGGIYTEGIVGSFTNSNPIYATSPVDASVSRLVFSSLMKYDTQNKLVGDLAEKVDVDDSGIVYTVRMHKDARWHDGRPVTADDVVFTYRTIQKPDAQSPLLPNWQKVDIKARGKHTVVFRLPHPLASFRHSLTNGIVPAHHLKKIPPTELRSAAFNTVNPVGSGLFKWDAVQVAGSTPETREEHIGLVANTDYYGNSPNLERFVIRAFHNRQALMEEFERGTINGAAGLDDVPDSVNSSFVAKDYNVPLTGEVMVFFRNSQTLLKDKAVRLALTRAVNQNTVVESLGYPVVLAQGPLLGNHTGYNPKIVQAGFDQSRAKKILTKGGWKVAKDGFRYKKKQKLTFKLHTQSESQYEVVASVLKRQWAKVGADVVVVPETSTKLQTTIAFHSYDALLYGITIGSDPDVYAFWHSSQADPRAQQRLNLSEYKSDIADAALAVGRSRLNEKLRSTKYKPFLEAWRADAPAIALYQPRYLYVTNIRLYGFEPQIFNTAVDRYANVENWAVRQDWVNIY